MNRESAKNALRQDICWDIIVIGGGATGLGVAVDAALRGYKTLLLEQADFTKGTSSRSTKLVHGGVRYLEQGNVSLVLEALYERGVLLKNAPHITSNQTFVIPTFSFWKSMFYATGLKLYDWLSGKLSLGSSKMVEAAIVEKQMPGLKTEGLKKGILYHDGQFDDARLGINLAQTCVDAGGTVVNYMKVTGLAKDGQGKLSGLNALDIESGEEYQLQAKTIVNATGVFSDYILFMDCPGRKPAIQPSQGVHIVLDKKFLPSEHALMVPKTKDGRVLFAVPWYGKIVAGTTDTLVDKPSSEPRALQEEVDFIIDTLGKYLVDKPEPKDVLSVFAGMRPLVRPEAPGQKTKEISRSHKITISSSGLVSISGGKWTTYRKMAEDTVNVAIQQGALSPYPCKTSQHPIHGYTQSPAHDWLHCYGADADKIRSIMEAEEGTSEKLHPNYPHVKAEVVWAARQEMARNVEDVLARRLRILFVDAKAAIDMAQVVAETLAQELNKDTLWVENQKSGFIQLAQEYLLEPYNPQVSSV
ncbi:glycerol-3-phosphate dehydrogenase/oxidase [Cytophagaceae bacterium ABcell3]|nr:glycerol-3-phosphate dehydrogenase/oxidase [Cytophagaceae bacterium ABcell3]